MHGRLVIIHESSAHSGAYSFGLYPLVTQSEDGRANVPGMCLEQN